MITITDTVVNESVIH